MCPLIRAYWRHLVNTIELVFPLAYPSPQPKGKLIASAVFAHLTAKSPHFYNGPLSPKIAPSHGGSGLRRVRGS